MLYSWQWREFILSCQTINKKLMFKNITTETVSVFFYLFPLSSLGCHIKQLLAYCVSLVLSYQPLYYPLIFNVCLWYLSSYRRNFSFAADTKDCVNTFLEETLFLCVWLIRQIVNQNNFNKHEIYDRIPRPSFFIYYYTLPWPLPSLSTSTPCRKFNKFCLCVGYISRSIHTQAIHLTQI